MISVNQNGNGLFISKHSSNPNDETDSFKLESKHWTRWKWNSNIKVAEIVTKNTHFYEPNGKFCAKITFDNANHSLFQLNNFFEPRWTKNEQINERQILVTLSLDNMNRNLCSRSKSFKWVNWLCTLWKVFFVDFIIKFGQICGHASIWRLSLANWLNFDFNELKHSSNGQFCWVWRIFPPSFNIDSDWANLQLM